MADHPAFELVPGRPGVPLLLVCDHASNAVPAALGGTLGLPREDMERHIAFDVGARGLTLELAELLGATAILSTTSRLVIDPNRGEDDPTLVMKLYDGSIIPGNRAVDEAEVARRLAAYHRPYHDAITAHLDAMIARGEAPQILSIHSYTPQLRGRAPRPWHVGVLWDEDARIARPLIDRLMREPDLCVGDNEPYSGQLRGDCMFTHGTQRGIAHALIELRNDLISDAAGETAWARRLAPILAETCGLTEGVTHG
ncbi:N-formylglutamate amidohydrolase [Oceanomicrobium pacificus]|uniref:N-formylglutamate amidohydrolase n=1 Tax=Oceanomicrobium pacificus TaxID=2692916 RepID=A0A6B0TQH7_9RHOB|nr:N-formylglutamate amidohydrolase [Oceanomicrobium pacificus]MXU64028.1 N-formylglutamate amidohydrolase [Oceanomicrobium pacificus]